MKKTRHRQTATSIAVAVIVSATALGSCSTVKEYQKNKLNDGEMTLGSKKNKKTESSFQFRGCGAGCWGAAPGHPTPLRFQDIPPESPC